MLRLERLLLCATAVLLGVGGAAGAQEPPLTIALSKGVVVYGDPVELKGTISLDLSSKIVTILARSEGEEQRDFATVGPGVTGFEYVVRPRIRTSFYSQIETTVSRTVIVKVRPRVTLALRRGVFMARVVAGKSFAGRTVLLQRLTEKGRWVGVKKGVLRRNPVKFRLKSRLARTKIRAFLPRSKTEPGYLEGFSKPVVPPRGRRR
ncbi:MAG: hypothetical protein LC685_04065 [Actinobacteria bacterium]|nr:hypothetical protein [Actinomycetota bacterium]